MEPLQKERITELGELSPFELKNELIAYAREASRSKSAAHAFLDAGRGNPNWLATTPREAFFMLGQFALEESKQVWDEPDLGGMPRAERSAARLLAFLERAGQTPGTALLRRSLEYATATLGFDADSFVHELCDAIAGDNYPVPDRMLIHCHEVVHRFLIKTMCADRPPPGKFQLFAVEGGTAAMCYVFKSLMTNRILRKGDTIAIGTPIFTPYIELPHLEEFDLKVVEIAQTKLRPDGSHAWQYPESEIQKLADPRIKAFFIVNPSNPASFALAPETQASLVRLVRERRPDLLILTDDVYGTFVDGFRSLAADLPENSILVYSYSKHFGCTGWRLGVVAIHENHLLDRVVRSLPEADREALRDRYAPLTPDPDSVEFIDRIVADSRDVALNHTAGLSTPQQVQMALFSLFALTDEDDRYQNRCRTIVKERLSRLIQGLGVALPEDPRRVGYYVDLDLEVWGRKVIGDAFVEYVEAHHDPLELVLGLARRTGTVLLNGSGFNGPPWSVRVSLANLDADAYASIGSNLKAIAAAAVERWQRAAEKGRK